MRVRVALRQIPFQAPLPAALVRNGLLGTPVNSCRHQRASALQEIVDRKNM